MLSGGHPDGHQPDSPEQPLDSLIQPLWAHIGVLP